MRGSLVVLIVFACVLGAPAAASALPGDPPPAPLAPADGATLPVDADGIPVSFACPLYRVSDDGFIPLYGGVKDYGVSLSDSPALGADGRLEGAIRNTASADPATAGTCNAALGAGGPPPRVQDTPGTYYWQVYRICVGCPGSYEVGPVRSFTLRSLVAPALTVPQKAYDGYPFLVSIALAGAPDGTQAIVERKNGAGWLKLATASAAGGKAEAVVTLARGDRQLRATVRIGSQSTSGQPKHVDVKRARNWSTSARANGRYEGTGSGLKSISFRIAAKGRELRDLDAKVPMLCPGIQAGQFTTQIGTAKLRKARIAPDGRFVAASAPGSGTAIRVRGRLVGRKVLEGRIELSVGNCSGSQAYGASRAGR
jgi:hypothetical protein